MLNPRVASRYAKSVLDLAIEKGVLEKVYEDMLYLKQLTSVSSEFVALLRSPVINADIKSRAVAAVTAGKISELSSTFINLLIKKAREGVLPEVITAFIDQYKVNKNIHTIKLTTATPISEELKNMFIEQVKTGSNIENIEMETVVDPEIIGGYVLQAGDRLVDASISHDLKLLSRKFENNDFIYKVR